MLVSLYWNGEMSEPFKVRWKSSLVDTDTAIELYSEENKQLREQLAAEQEKLEHIKLDWPTTYADFERIVHELKEQLAARQRDITECVVTVEDLHQQLAAERDRFAFEHTAAEAWRLEVEELKKQLAAERKATAWEKENSTRLQDYAAHQLVAAVEALKPFADAANELHNNRKSMTFQDEDFIKAAAVLAKLEGK